MSAELTPITAWTFHAEVPIPRDIGSILIPGEQPIAAYKTFRDAAVFTDRRIVVRDSQGITGKKVEMYSVPYSSINMWSSENAGTFDFNSEIELWTRAGHIKITLGKGVDVRRLDHLIAQVVLGSAR
ncbi:PH domain-containing protein [Tessaracoccus sp. OS52]|uniref:PH domain-containing protein n=1 Tax=Tessaracoccus sp. OS52 TaxID=2886691 RepID=UPI001D12E716|nr:PH domain-containing protein [Tessaracoccus sp. OS52]MCC2594036.1 PH domain-containing protein [Tessaracoccus sp. OS52]